MLEGARCIEHPEQLLRSELGRSGFFKLIEKQQPRLARLSQVVGSYSSLCNPIFGDADLNPAKISYQISQATSDRRSAVCDRVAIKRPGEVSLSGPVATNE